MTALGFLQLFPELTNVNGDAENALVLARRTEWAGGEGEVVRLAAGEPVPDRAPAAIVLGSGVDSALVRVRAALEAIRGPLTDWLAAGIPLLAVGTGLELLGRRVDLADGSIVGLGIVPGETVALPRRAAGELVLDSAWGRLFGYENHGRGFLLDDGVAAFGRVVSGTGNGGGTGTGSSGGSGGRSGAGVDGVQFGSVYGTHLHGPVLARNPALAMAVLASAAGPGLDAYAPGRADGVADAVNTAAARRLGI